MWYKDFYKKISKKFSLKFERFLAPRSRFFEKVNGLGVLGQYSEVGINHHPYTPAANSPEFKFTPKRKPTPIRHTRITPLRGFGTVVLCLGLELGRPAKNSYRSENSPAFWQNPYLSVFKTKAGNYIYAKKQNWKFAYIETGLYLSVFSPPRSLFDKVNGFRWAILLWAGLEDWACRKSVDGLDRIAAGAERLDWSVDSGLLELYRQSC
ncbi:hypothetical protein LXL04_006534 [Taraxacum kok-saghyz]